MSASRARSLLELLVLAATSLCLIGHGGSIPTCMFREGETRSYNVTGTCGAAGVITVTWSPGLCQLQVTGDDVGLPTSGNLASKLDDGFDLYGSVNRDWDLVCNAGAPSRVDAGAQPAGALIVACSRKPSPANPSDPTITVPWCEGQLIPVSTGCDLRACAPVVCADGQHTAFSDNGCCASCVNDGPGDVVPVPPAPVCHLETCAASCPDGQDMVPAVDGGCCSTCAQPPPDCLAGRAQWESELSTRWKDALSCATDADCAVTVFGSPCEPSCLGAAAIADIPRVSEWAYLRGQELCATCPAPGANRACPALQGGRAMCASGACVKVDP